MKFKEMEAWMQERVDAQELVDTPRWNHSVTMETDQFTGNRMVRMMVRGPFDDERHHVDGVTRKYAAMFIVPEEAIMDAAANAKCRKDFEANFNRQLYNITVRAENLLISFKELQAWFTAEGTACRVVQAGVPDVF